MSEADAVAGVLWAGVTAYAVFGGADFGAGFWSLVAGGGERGRRARGLVDWAIGPVWEANHVWLIFVLVVLWTGFSTAFESIFSTLFIPLSLAALGIVLRGSGFAFHKAARRVKGRGFAERLFGISSLLTPFFMGTVVGAIASGRVPVGNATGDAGHELGQPAVAGHRRAVRRHVRLPRRGVPRQRRTPRRRTPDLERYFTVRALGGRRRRRRAGRRRALRAARRRPLRLRRPDRRRPAARHRLRAVRRRGARPAVARGAPRAPPARGRRRRGGRSGAGASPSTRTCCRRQLTIAAGAAPSATLTGVLIVFGAAVALVIPSIVLLFTLVQRSLVEEGASPEQARTHA